MAITVEKLVAELKWDTNRTELAKARTDADKLKAASKQLEEEQRKSVRTTHKLREEIQDLRVAAKAGIITQAIKDLKLKYPQPTAEELKQIAKAKKMLAGK